MYEKLTHASFSFGPVEFEGKEQVFEAQVKDLAHVYHAGSNVIVVRVAEGSAVVTLDGKSRSNQIIATSFINPVLPWHNPSLFLLTDCVQLIAFLQARLAPATQKKKQSMFSLRTDDACAAQYFQFYGFLSQQQNMLQVGMGKK